MQKYSVLMAVYKKDSPEYFAVALDSMINQTYPADEIVIVKDGPITPELQAVIDARSGGAVAINEVALAENQGVGVARNEGLKVCRNEFVAVMDSDDYSLPERCELQLKEFEKNPSLDIIGSPVKEFVGTMDNIVAERTVPITNDEIYKFANYRDPFNHPTVMYKKSTVIKSGGYGSYRRNIDTDLWVRLLHDGAICKNFSEALVLFRFDEGAYQRRRTWECTKSLIEVKYKAWRYGVSSLMGFLSVSVVQVGVFILPLGFQKFLYQRFLRK